MTPTAARPVSQDGAHFYTMAGQPCHSVPYADPKKGFRPTTLADCRKLNLLPSCTTILKLLNKPELNNWRTEQACLALLTTPRLHAEKDDEFVERVLHTERVQDEEMEAARDLGTRLHEALENLALNKPVDADLLPWVTPAWEFIRSLGVVLSAETCVVGQGFAGKVDLMLSPGPEEVLLVDYKTSKRLPDKAPWKDHLLQLSAYCSTQKFSLIRAGNLYVSTAEQGKFVWFEHTDIHQTFVRGFMPLVCHWQWSTGYFPKQ